MDSYDNNGRSIIPWDTAMNTLESLFQVPQPHEATFSSVPQDHHMSSLYDIPTSSFFSQEPIGEEEDDRQEYLGTMKEMLYKMAAMQPVDIDPSTIKKPVRRNVRISTEPQSVAARHRRERISERIRILQRLVPGGTKMDTATMLDEAASYLKFLKKMVQELRSTHYLNLAQQMITEETQTRCSSMEISDELDLCFNNKINHQ